MGVSDCEVGVSGGSVTPTYHTHMPQWDIGKFGAVEYSDNTELYNRLLDYEPNTD